MIKRSRASIVAALSALVLSSLTSFPAVAGGDAPSGSSGPTNPGAACAFRLDPTGPAVRGTVPAAAVPIGCYPTLAEAIEAGTGGEVDLSADVTVASLTQDLLDDAGALAAADVLVGIEYDNTNYGGSSSSYFAPSPCNVSNWEVSYVGNTWNDRFESGKGFSSCDINVKFQNSQFGDPKITCTPNCSTYSGLRNQVSSLRWKN